MFRMIEYALLLAGLVQLGIAGSSLMIPRVLGWREETARLKPLTRQVFWTYAVYILSMNTAFGLLALLAPKALVDGSLLARAVTGFIAVYWLGRVTVQLVVFDRSITVRPLFRVAEAAYFTAFLYLAVTYSVAAVLQ
jgi:hypothetical protein